MRRTSLALAAAVAGCGLSVPAMAGVMGPTDSSGWLLATGVNNSFYAVQYSGGVQPAKTLGSVNGDEIAVTDLNANGYSDILLGRTDRYLSWVQGDGTNLTQTSSLNYGTGATTNSVTSFRYGGTNYVANYTPTSTTAGYVRWTEKSGSGDTLSLVTSSANIGPGSRIRSGDLNGDGNDSLLAVRGGSYNYYMYVYEPTGSGATRALTQAQTINLGTSAPIGPGVNIGNVDGDSYADVLISTTAGSGTIQWWEYNGTSLANVATVSGVISAGMPITDMVFSDADGDGNGEVIVARQNGYVQVYERSGNTLSLAGTPISLNSAGYGIFAMDIGDYDGDGLKDDVIIGSQSTGMNMAKWYTYSMVGNVPTMTFVQDIDLGTTIRDIQIVDAVPEPAALGLLAIGAVGLMRRRRS